VADHPHFLAARSAPEPNSTRSFSIAFYLLRTQRSHAWNSKILRRRSGSLPLKSLNSPPSLALLFQSFAHLLSFHVSFQYFVHYCCHEDDLASERGITREGHVMCTSRINQLGEGLRRSERGHRRSRHAISNDGR
jgi:hypothetical protein